jgi:hypothetical protein
MPTYRFKDNNTKKTIIIEMRISEYDQFILDNPHLIQLPSAPGIISGIPHKPANEFRSLLKKIKKENKGSNINTF